MKNFLTLFLLLSFAFSQAVGGQSGPKQAVGGEKPTSKPTFGAKNHAANGAKQDAAAKNGVRQGRSAKGTSPLTGSKFSDYSGLKFVPRPSLKGKHAAGTDAVLREKDRLYEAAFAPVIKKGRKIYKKRP